MDLYETWRALATGALNHPLVRPAIVGAALFVVIYLLERLHGVQPAHYRSRGFLHDAAYWFYYRTGLHYFLFLSVLFGALSTLLAPVQLRLLAGIPFAAQVILYLLIVDFCVYWIHRAQHRFGFLWAFHATHHSQTELSFLTSQRVHPLDHLFQDVLMFAPLYVLGFSESAWIPLYLWGEFNLAAQHSRIPWKYGPLYRIVVSPAFHSFHHSIDPAHHNRNFAGLFSLWDYAFGTAVRDHSVRPRRFGLPGEEPATLAGSLTTAPLARLRSAYVRD
jgi:sterol desaturase/sphingolipid hydroxylase (fatty acid hydroxylase superfamily)